MHKQRNRPARWTAFLAAALAGGTLFGTCETRIRDSVVDGTKFFVFNLLDPSNLTIDFGDAANTDANADTATDTTN